MKRITEEHNILIDLIVNTIQRFELIYQKPQGHMFALSEMKKIMNSSVDKLKKLREFELMFESVEKKRESL